MSTILDALRRAEAERGRGAVPGLHSPGLPLPDGASAARPWAWAALALAGAGALALAGVLGWQAGERGRSPPAAVAGSAPAASAVEPPAPAPAPAAAPAPAPAPIPAPALARPAASPTAAAPAPPPAAPRAAAPAPAARRLVAAPPPAAAPASTPALPTEAALAPAPLALSQLSAEQRREWPALVLGGSVYSDSPASRFLIANGQLVREGEAAAPGVTVERIGPRSAVLRWRALRVEVPL